MSENNGKLWAWRIVQITSGLILAGVSVTTPIVVAAISEIHESTHALSERLTAIEAARFTPTDANDLQRQIDTKAGMVYCAQQWARVNEKLNLIHRLVVRLESRADDLVIRLEARTDDPTPP